LPVGVYRRGRKVSMGKTFNRQCRIVELYAGTARSAEPFRAWKHGEIALLADSSNFAKKTYLANFPDAPYVKLNLATTTLSDVVRRAGGRIDVLLGCPPCQGFSESGKRDPDDPRNSHMGRFARIIEAAKPKAIALENVPLSATSPEYQRVIAILEKLGYRWKATIANAVQYGSCQSRQRLILVAFRGDLKVEPKFPAPTHGGNKRVFSYSSRTFRSIASHVTDMLGIAPSTQRLARGLVVSPVTELGSRKAKIVWDQIGDLPNVDTAAAIKTQHVKRRHSTAILQRMGHIAEGGQWSGASDHYSHSYGRLHRSGFARTITGFFPYAGSGRFWHPFENRSLTVREAARIQGFPDSFQFLDNTRKTASLVGNALDSVFATMCYNIIRAGLE
jgi:DNA (cytosine-5)-methyltransferase 1